MRKKESIKGREEKRNRQREGGRWGEERRKEERKRILNVVSKKANSAARFSSPRQKNKRSADTWENWNIILVLLSLSLCIKLVLAKWLSRY